MSPFDPQTGEVAALKELGGRHGRTGGLPTKPLLPCAAASTARDRRAVGLDGVHAVVRRHIAIAGVEL